MQNAKRNLVLFLSDINMEPLSSLGNNKDAVQFKVYVIVLVVKISSAFLLSGAVGSLFTVHL